MLSFLLLSPPPKSTLFPYTTLFRSQTSKSKSKKSVPGSVNEREIVALNTTNKSALVTVRAFCSKSRGNERRSEEHTSELQSRGHLVCRLLLEKKNIIKVETVRAYLL